MPTYLTPGIYIEEISTGAKPIESVGTSIAAFAGVAPNPEARLQEAYAVNSWSQFVREYVADGSAGTPLSHAVYGFFQNGGSRCYIVNVGTGGSLIGDGKRRQGIELFEEVDEIAIIAAPGYTDIASYDALLSHLQAAYPGYQADFVYSPRSRLLHTALADRHAAFDPEQQKMVLRSPPPYVPDSRVQLYTPAFRAQYLALHDDDRYWTGERVLAAQDTFRVLLAIEDGAVAGYLDLAYRNTENEPYDLFVREKSRRRGLGRALLSCAIEKNRPNAMSLLVDSDNLAARRLYASLGFVEKPEENNITAHLKL